MDITDSSDTEKDVYNQSTDQVEDTVRLFDNDGHVRKIPIPSTTQQTLSLGPLGNGSAIMLCLCVFGIAGFGVVQPTPLFFGGIIPEYMGQTRGVRHHTIFLILALLIAD
jgi:hypothetical protein